MSKYEVTIKAPAYAKVTIEAPNEETALEYLSEHVDYYNANWEVEEMDGEIDAGKYSEKAIANGAPKGYFGGCVPPFWNPWRLFWHVGPLWATLRAAGRTLGNPGSHSY